MRTTTEDGRNFDPARGELSGEAAQMKVGRPSEALPIAEAVDRLPIRQRPDLETESRTYYEMPVIKPPPWKWYIPAYFYVGGLAGASAALAAAVRLSRRRDLERLAKKGRWIGVVGDAASAGLLIADLGRPARFYNMLRVFRPTSPMNVGTWILTASGIAGGLSALFAGGRKLLGRVGRAAETVAGVVGLPLSTYTAVLLSNTAVPLWKGARRTLPVLFGASAASSSASLLELSGPRTEGERRTVKKLAVAGKAGELVAMGAVERELGASRAGRPLREGNGRSRKLWTAAKICGAAGLAASVFSGKSRGRAFLAGALGTAGALAMRFAVVEAGVESARDPRATFEPQRERRSRRSPARRR